MDTDTAYPYTWPAADKLGCWKDGAKCSFLEDFGARYPWDATFVYLYVGGDDIEKDELDILITKIDCDPMARVETDLMGDKRLDTTSVIYRNTPGSLLPLIRFRPGPDRNNNNGGYGNYYCNVSYKVRDEEGAISYKENLISVNVSPVDDPPRLRDGLQLVTAIEQQPKTFFVDAISVESRSFRVVLKSCKNTQGTFEYCLDDACTTKRPIDCSSIPTGGLVFEPLIKSKKRDAASDLQAGVASYGYDIIFTSGNIYSLRQGLGYQGLQFAFDDNVASGDEFSVNINVVSLNEAPAFIVNNVTTTDAVTTMDVNINKGSPFRPGLTATDKDIANGDATIEITFDPQDGSHFTIDTTALGIRNVKKFDEKVGITFEGKLIQVNEALQTFAFYPKDDSLGKKYTVTFNVNDQGYTGQCGDPASATLSWDGKPCPLEAKLNVVVASVDSVLINSTAIAAGGLAAIGVTALVAIAAMRLFNKKAMDGAYAPWNSFESDASTLDNPLYEASGIEGNSPIYSSKSYMEMGSVPNGDSKTWL